MSESSKDFFKEAVQVIKDRIGNSVLFSYMLSTMAVNFRAVLMLFSDEAVNKKIQFIDSTILKDSDTALEFLVLRPGIGVLLYVLGIPLMSIIAAGAQELFKIWQDGLVSWIQRKRFLTADVRDEHWRLLDIESERAAAENRKLMTLTVSHAAQRRQLSKYLLDEEREDLEVRYRQFVEKNGNSLFEVRNFYQAANPESEYERKPDLLRSPGMPKEWMAILRKLNPGASFELNFAIDTAGRIDPNHTKRSLRFMVQLGILDLLSDGTQISFLIPFDRYRFLKSSEDGKHELGA